MLTRHNTRYQVLPFYKDTKDWYINTCRSCGCFLTFPTTQLPPFQLVLPEGIDPIANNSVLVNFDTLAETPLTTIIEEYEFNNEFYTGVPNKIITFVSGTAAAGRYYIKTTINGTDYFSEPFKVCDSHQYLLTWKNSCPVSGLYYDGAFEQKFYFDQLTFNRPRVREVKETERDANNKLVVISQYIERKENFTEVLPDYLIDAFIGLNFHDDVTLTNLETGEVYTLTDFEVEPSGSELECFHNVTVAFNMVSTSSSGWISGDLQKTGCCELIPIDDPFVPTDCSGYSTEIQFNTPFMTFTTGSLPVGDWVATWYRNGKIVGSGSKLAHNNIDGTYKIVISYKDCVIEDTYVLQSAVVCPPYEVAFNVVGNVISGITNIPSPNYEILDSAQSPVSTSLPFTFTASDIYTVKVDDGAGCEHTTIIPFELNETCAHTVTIQRATDELTAIIGTPPAGSPTYEWLFEDHDGAVVISTTDTATITENGMYKLRVTYGTCMKETYILVFDKCAPVTICNADEIQTTINVTGSIENCP